MQPQASTIMALHVDIEFSLVEYDMCSCLLFFYIASTQPDCCSDGRFEDFPGVGLQNAHYQCGLLVTGFLNTRYINSL
jgi:hypothetical protein